MSDFIEISWVISGSIAFALYLDYSRFNRRRVNINTDYPHRSFMLMLFIALGPFGLTFMTGKVIWTRRVHPTYPHYRN